MGMFTFGGYITAKDGKIYETCVNCGCVAKDHMSMADVTICYKDDAIIKLNFLVKDQIRIYERRWFIEQRYSNEWKLKRFLHSLPDEAVEG